MNYIFFFLVIILLFYIFYKIFCYDENTDIEDFRYVNPYQYTDDIDMYNPYYSYPNNRWYNRWYNRFFTPYPWNNPTRYPYYMPYFYNYIVPFG